MPAATEPVRPPQSAQRSGREKVAILLLALGGNAGTRLLQKFSAEDVKQIMTAASSIRQVDKQDLDVIVDDFAAHFAQAIGIGTDFDAVKKLVEQAFPADELNRMLGGQSLLTREPVWRKFAGSLENTLVPYLLDEHPQTVAFVLSKLDAESAARCLSILPGDFRLTVASRLLRMQHVAPEAERIVEEALETDLLSKGGSGAEEEGRSRLAAMLNRLDREQSSAILDGLAAQRPEDATRLKRMIFSFEDLGRLSQASRLALFDKLQTEQVIAALRGMPPAVKEVALSSLGARARRMVEAELASDKGARTKDGDAARAAIAARVLEMAQRGELELPSDGETAAA